MTHSMKKSFLFGVAVFAVFGFAQPVRVALAQQTPTLDDLAVIQASQGNNTSAAPSTTTNVQSSHDTRWKTNIPVADTSSDLAGQAQSQDASLKSGNYQPTKPDLKYADPAQTQRIEKQVTGDYGDIARTQGLPLGTTQDAWDRPYDNMSQGQSAPGVVHFNWSQELAMPVRMREFMDTMIVLPEWEGIKDWYLGENYYFSAKRVRKNTLAIRVRGAGVDTNLNIVGTSGNLYTFYVRAEGYNAKTITDMSVFIDAAPINPGMWFKGDTQATAMGAAQDAGSGPASSQTPQSADDSLGDDAANTVSGGNLYIPSLDLKFVHRMFEVHPGDRAIAPEYVATDGRWTYFYYGDKAGTVDMPTVFRLVDGVEEPVQTKTIGAKGETLVVPRVGEFVLRNGQKTVCVKIAANSVGQ